MEQMYGVSAFEVYSSVNQRSDVKNNTCVSVQDTRPH